MFILALICNVPLTAAGSLSYPVTCWWDSDGVVVSPAAPAEEVVCDGGEQKRLETFLKQRVAGSHPTIGTYPPNPETLPAYEV